MHLTTWERRLTESELMAIRILMEQRPKDPRLLDWEWVQVERLQSNAGPALPTTPTSAITCVGDGQG